MNDEFIVLLRLMLEEAAAKQAEQTLQAIQDKMKGVDKATEDTTKEIQKQEKATISAMKKEAAAINRLASLRAKELADLKEKAAWIERGAKPLFALGIAGFTAITALAKKYIDNTEESNAITQRWAAATERVQDAQMRIGKIAAEAVLPLYEKLADIAEKTADFVDKHPGIIEGGLKASIIAAGLGGIGLLVSKGITLYADYKMIAVGDMQLVAAKIMADAAQKQLAAATTGSITGKVPGVGGVTATAAGTGGTAAAAGSAGGLLTAAVTGLALVIGAKIGEYGGQALGKAFYGPEFEANIGNAAQNFYRLWSIPGQAVILKLKEMGLVSNEFAASVSGFVGTIDQGIGQLTGAAQSNAAANNQAMQAAQNSARASMGASMAFRSVQSTSTGAAQSLSRVPSAFAAIASSVSSFFQRIVSSLSGIRQTAGSGLSLPTHDYTGYAYTRAYAMAQDGKRQFVMSGDMTRIAEQMLGGQLNQQAVLSALANGSSSRTLNLNGMSFSGEYTKSMKRAVKNDMLQTLRKVID